MDLDFDFDAPLRHFTDPIFQPIFYSSPYYLSFPSWHLSDRVVVNIAKYFIALAEYCSKSFTLQFILWSLCIVISYHSKGFFRHCLVLSCFKFCFPGEIFRLQGLIGMFIFLMSQFDSEKHFEFVFTSLNFFNSKIKINC
jgi:hypothetical protein